MSPSLEGTMFNRSANLSARRPLLQTDSYNRPAFIHSHDRNGFTVQGTGTPLSRHRPVPRTPPIEYGRNPYAYGRSPWTKPSNVEIERRLPATCNGYDSNGKIAYFHKKITPPIDLGLDRREAELVFRFDNTQADYLTSQYTTPTVQYCKNPLPVNGFPRPDQNGPFVFGVHNPSHFPKPRQQTEEDYDYSEVAEEPVPKDLTCCDKLNEWSDGDKNKNILYRTFQIKGSRKCKSKKDKIKCVLVGDGEVGKTSLITAYAQNTFSEDYQPTAYDTFNVVVEVDDRPVCVEICDTAGQDSMSELRALCYPGTDVLMLCFSVVRPETFRSVAERWTKAVSGVGAPLILVGTQTDLAYDARVLEGLRKKGEHVVTEAEARALASKFNAVYVETSAKTRNKLKDAFDSAILAALPVISHKRPLWKKLLCVAK